MTTFGSTTEDLDGVPIERGPKAEDRRTEAELRGAMRDIAAARASVGEIVTIRGIQSEVEFLKMEVGELKEANNRQVTALAQLRQEFTQFQQQRAIELQSWLANGGSTTPEDMDGA